MTARQNIYAPAVYNGIPDASPPGYVDVAFDYIYDIALTASQLLTDRKTIDNDADFVLRAVVINASTGLFSVRFSDSNNYWLSSARILSTNILGDGASPYPIFPEILIPAGGFIGIEERDETAAPNTIQIAFRGCKRYQAMEASRR